VTLRIRNVSAVGIFASGGTSLEAPAEARSAARSSAELGMSGNTIIGAAIAGALAVARPPSEGRHPAMLHCCFKRRPA